MILSMLGVGLRLHAGSALFAFGVLTLGGCLAGLPFWLPGLAWGIAALGAVEGWYLLEGLACRCRGLRPATVDEVLLLGAPGLEVYVAEEDAFRFGPGLRSLTVSRGALEVCEPECLEALAAHAELAAEAGPLLVGVGLAPVLAFAWLGWAVSRLGVLLALAVGSALVMPFWIWGDGFTRAAGRVFGVVLVFMLGLELLASGLTLLGLGVLSGWGLARIARALLDREARQVDGRADRAVVAAGLGPALLRGLELRRGLGEPIAPRIAELRLLLADAAV